MALPRLAIRPAAVDELDTVLALLRERTNWLRRRGFDQWSTWDQWRVKIPPTVERGQVWLLLDGADPIGTITVEFRGDSDFWTPEECAEPAAYLSKLAVSLDYAGSELGALVMAWASDYAFRRGCRWLRLDAWKTNPQLHNYYAERSWTYLRTVDNPRRNSGALFQKTVRPMTRAERQTLQDAFEVDVLEGAVGGPGTTEPDPAQNWHPQHVHRGGLRVRYNAMAGDPAPAQLIDFMRYRVRQVRGTWLLESVDRHFADWRTEGDIVGSPPGADKDATYVITHQEIADGCRMVIAQVPSDVSRCTSPNAPGASGADPQGRPDG